MSACWVLKGSSAFNLAEAKRLWLDPAEPTKVCCDFHGVEDHYDAARHATWVVYVGETPAEARSFLNTMCARMNDGDTVAPLARPGFAALLLTWAECETLGTLIDNAIEAVEAAHRQDRNPDLASDWSEFNALRTAVREAQASVRP